MKGDEALFRILSNQCPSSDYEGEYITFEIELHCIHVKIVAKPVIVVLTNGTYAAHTGGVIDNYDYTVWEIKEVTFS